LRSNPLGELIQLRRDGTVVEYQGKFLTLLTRCEDLTEKHQINIFTAGLRNPVRIDVELKKLTTLEDAMALARTYEQRLVMTEDILERLSPAKMSSFCTPVKPLALTGPLSTAAPVPRLKRPSATEMAAKREKGECFNCTEKFSKEHLKSCSMKGVYLL
jgi:hypothetical protein